ncbi:hypothetical protein [Methylocella sp.]|uniref:hypothetical protein n=1 Tax=Methylocella sp. TaxID=1978226 RepID=UPI0037838999
MKTVLMSPPGEAGRAFLAIHGRVYEGAPGDALHIPDFDAPVLEANGWAILAAPPAPASTAVYASGVVSGVVFAPGGAAGLGVRLYLDGAGTPAGVATTDAGGAWSIATGALSPGAHGFSVEIDETAGVFVVGGGGSAGGAMDFSDPANSGLVAALAA